MNLRSVDLNLLLCFEALIIERNVTRAAWRVGLSQPATSNALARLRSTFNDPLFVRTPEGMSPTPAAQALAGPVRSALSLLRSAIEEKRIFDPRDSKQTFHLLANDHLEMMLLAGLMGQVRSRASGITLRVHRPERIFQAPSAAALADSFDLAIGFFPDIIALDASLHSEVLREEATVCIAAANHPSIRGKLSARQYSATHHVAVFYKAEGPGFIDALLQQKGYRRHTAAFAPHFSSIPFIVAGSDLIATVPETLARRFSAQLKLQVLPVPFAIPPFRWTMLWHERVDGDPASVWLRSLVVEAAGSQF
jgi:DNA-binding transcriptional LysR family regulator